MRATRSRATRIALFSVVFVAISGSSLNACSSSSSHATPNADAAEATTTMTGACPGFAKDLTVAAIWTSSDILSGPFTSPNASGSYTSGEDAGAWPLLEISVSLGAIEAGATGFQMGASLEDPNGEIPDGPNVTNATQLGSSFDVTVPVFVGTSETIDLTATCATGESVKIILTWTQNGGPIAVAIQ